MSGFLLLLVKVNLAMGAAIALVSFLRRPLRAQFGAPIAYAIWLLVPIAGVAVLIPPREIPPPVHIASEQAPAVPAPVTGHIPQSTLAAMEQAARNDLIVPPTPVKPLGSSHEIFDSARLIFAAWLFGLLLMAAHLTRLQLRFSAAVRRGQAGPAVLGFWRPRIVTPASFQDQFTPQEQAAILAHERVHLGRQDARINALVAMLRCFCWFNPLFHLGARWLRIDQELACDAIAVSSAISRRDYSMALLKSQVMVGVLPFGCNWPGPQHPLVERIELLQRQPPGTVRRFAGAGLVLLAATFAGLGAWAAQPPVAANAVSAEQPRLAPTTLAAIAPAQNRTAGSAGSGQAAATANPSRSNAEVEVSKAASEASMTTAPPNSATATDAQASAATPTDSIAAKPLPRAVSPPETGVASIDLPAAPVLPPPNAAPVVAFNDRHGGQSATRDLTTGPVQASSSARSPAPPKLDMTQPYTMTTCGAGDNPINTRDGAFMARVASPTSVQVPFFAACRKTYGEYARWASWARQGRCENNAHMILHSIWGPYCPVEPWFTISLLFADPADAGKMPLGKVVRLKGVPFVITQNNVDYLGLKDARFMYADPFGRSGTERSAMMETPRQSTNAAAAPGNAIIPARLVSAPEISLASNDLSPAPALPPANASPAMALKDQPVRQPATRDLSAGPVQARLSTPSAAPPRLDTNAPYKMTMCNMLDTGTLTGRVTSPTTIQLPSFGCARTSFGGLPGETGGGGNGYRMSFDSGDACRKSHTKFIRGSILGPVCPIAPLLTVTVLLANPADSSKMPLGKVVTLKGDRFVITQNNVDYLGVKNASILYADPFGR